MALWGKSARTAAVIDIRSSSVGAAYVCLDSKSAPCIAYATRTPIDAHATEPIEEALPRALESTLHDLVTAGAPALRARAGTGSADTVLVTVASPWQGSKVESRVIAPGHPFTFTRDMLDKSATTNPEEANKTRVSEMIIATMLNGYEVENPFGKRVNRAELVLLSSAIDSAFMEFAAKQIRKTLHHHAILWNAFLPEAFDALRTLYAHQRDFLVLDVGGEATDMMLVKHGLAVAMASMPHGVNELTRAARTIGVSSPTVPVGSVNMLDTDRNTSFASRVEEMESAWLASVHASLAEIAKQEPLPRTVLLIAEESVRDFLRRLLDAPSLRPLWLTEEPLGILPVQPSQFASFLGGNTAEATDPMLGLLALAVEARMK